MSDIFECEINILAYQYIQTLNDDEIFKLVNHHNFTVRHLAGMATQLRATTHLFNKVLTLQNQKPYYLREVCAYILGQFKTEKLEQLNAIPPILLKLTQDKSTQVKASAICALGHFCRHHKDLVEDFDEILNTILKYQYHKSADIRGSVAFALASIPDCEKVRTALNELLQDDDIDVQEWAEVALEILDLDDK